MLYMTKSGELIIIYSICDTSKILTHNYKIKLIRDKRLIGIREYVYTVYWCLSLFYKIEYIFFDLSKYALALPLYVMTNWLDSIAYISDKVLLNF